MKRILKDGNSWQIYTVAGFFIDNNLKRNAYGTKQNEQMTSKRPENAVLSSGRVDFKT
jgi:hypothetical protein